MNNFVVLNANELDKVNGGFVYMPENPRKGKFTIPRIEIPGTICW